MYIPTYFKKHELAPRHLCDIHTDVEIYGMYDPDLLRGMDRLRKNLNRKIIVNDWLSGGKFSQRGIRTDPKVGAPFSAHRIIPEIGQLVCKGIDFTVDGMTSHQVRRYLKDNAKKYPEFRRCELGTVHTHIDTIPAIYFFQP